MLIIMQFLCASAKSFIKIYIISKFNLVINQFASDFISNSGSLEKLSNMYLLHF